METEEPTEEQQELKRDNRDEIIEELFIEDAVRRLYKKFDALGCMYLKVDDKTDNRGRMYRRNNTCFLMRLNSSSVYLYDENIKPLTYESWDPYYCDYCNHEIEDTGWDSVHQHYFVNSMLDDEPLFEFLHENQFK